ncbi:MAG: site-specific integrase [Endozoicomonadaceae bacterium]|nr:site-specific integrase [Endozoicomonadaceae bacterium]
MITLIELRSKINKTDSHTRRVSQWLCRFDQAENSTEITVFAQWFCESILKKVSSRSRRSYLTSLKKTSECDQLHGFISGISCNFDEVQTTKTESIKKISWPEFAIIENDLAKSSEPWHLEVADWLRATILTGLRPIEWSDCQLLHKSSTGYYLKSMNVAKAESNEPANEYHLDEYRNIPLLHLDKSDLLCVQRHCAKARLYSELEEFNVWYERVRLKLYNVSKKCFPDKGSIKLYSGRHQFAANLKASGLPVELIAKLLGHANTQTARHYYGAKRHGIKLCVNKEKLQHCVNALYVDL